MAHAVSSRLRPDCKLKTTSGDQASVTLRPCVFKPPQPSDEVKDLMARMIQGHCQDADRLV